MVEALPAATQKDFVGRAGEALPAATQKDFVGRAGEALPAATPKDFVGRAGEALPAATQKDFVGREDEALPAATQKNFVGRAGEALPAFFPATQKDFVARAGEVMAVTTADFDDEHKRRHLESFAESMDAWRHYESRIADDLSKSPVTIEMVVALAGITDLDNVKLESELSKLRRKYKISPSKAHLALALKLAIEKGLLPKDCNLVSILVKRQVRTSSGVAVITVLTSPGKFSCPKDCHYCPNEPGQPRSYLSTEPAVLRANQCGWDSARQFWDRARTLHRNGHIVDKIEVLVLGGTWSGYSTAYQNEFVRDLFYAANVFEEFMKSGGGADGLLEDSTGPLCEIPEALRARKTLTEEQVINEDSSCKIIGLTLETRPDYINPFEIRKLRNYGCTRVQIGVQHTNEVVLGLINRGCTTSHVVDAIRLLKDSCFKVDIHLMPDLPGSNVELDEEMFTDVLKNPGLQADQWKIYPCEVTPFTVISQWYKEGKYQPYSGTDNEDGLIALILKVKRMVPPWIRLNRVVRDIPNQSIIAGNNKTNLRQLLEVACVDMGWRCSCIRCREVRTAIRSVEEASLSIRAYDTTGGKEYFLSFETTNRETLFAFLRLRLPYKDVAQDVRVPFEILNSKCALVRELHVYGMLVSTKETKTRGDSRQQHSGFGKSLLLAAERLASIHGFDSVAIIAGVGTRNYYRKFGYVLKQTYMFKELQESEILRLWRTGDYAERLPQEQLVIDNWDIRNLPEINQIEICPESVKKVLSRSMRKLKSQPDQTRIETNRAYEAHLKTNVVSRINLPLIREKNEDVEKDVSQISVWISDRKIEILLACCVTTLTLGLILIRKRGFFNRRKEGS